MNSRLSQLLDSIKKTKTKKRNKNVDQEKRHEDDKIFSCKLS